MSDDLVKRLQKWGKKDPFSEADMLMLGAADRIERLERELAIAEKMAADANEAYSQAHVSMIEAHEQLSAEKALADRLDEELGWHRTVSDSMARAAYRKARGL